MAKEYQFHSLSEVAYVHFPRIVSGLTALTFKNIRWLGILFEREVTGGEALGFSYM